MQWDDDTEASVQPPPLICTEWGGGDGGGGGGRRRRRRGQIVERLKMIVEYKLRRETVTRSCLTSALSSIVSMVELGGVGNTLLGAMSGCGEHTTSHHTTPHPMANLVLWTNLPLLLLLHSRLPSTPNCC
ncbi:unnamed protein product [Hydatigera taeniaeformis]|uniref:Uncharacterized protein n=1 Tax=Hydatigena taeniaeformis TaxID=6205 RepID=A0A0R3XCZ3_HYDTA|nr:unnamed protein product [Hydatigera taeniaeformis]